ncbi:hypothetical protein [uncultured Gammaproteobacteria bacterium]|nr:hypothetical protein [uncultured Gammaproteobacteria bacterium]
MNTATKIPGLPAVTADLLQSSDCLVDNLFADLWKSNSDRKKLASFSIPPLTDKGSSDDAH